jgi:hypothetical protein
MERFNFEANMEKIKELSSLMNIQFDETYWQTSKNLSEYKMVKGTCKGWGLYKTDKIAVQYVELSPDSEFPAHEHEKEREIIILFEGDFTTITKYGSQSCVDSGIIIAELGINHINKSVKGCKLIAITIPAAEGYPEGETICRL